MLSLLLVTAACSSAAQSGPGQPQATQELAGRLLPPDTIGGHPLAEKRAIPAAAGGGNVYRYTRGGEMWTDIYVYPRGNWGPSAEQVDQYKDMIFPESVRRGVYSEFNVMLRDVFDAPAAGRSELAELVRIEVLVGRARSRGRETFEYVMVTSVGDQFVKLRTTAPAGTGSTDDIRNLLIEFLKSGR